MALTIASVRRESQITINQAAIARTRYGAYSWSLSGLNGGQKGASYDRPYTAVRKELERVAHVSGASITAGGEVGGG